jgi:hypothetical protein
MQIRENFLLHWTLGDISSSYRIFFSFNLYHFPRNSSRNRDQNIFFAPGPWPKYFWLGPVPKFVSEWDQDLKFFLTGSGTKNDWSCSCLVYSLKIPDVHLMSGNCNMRRVGYALQYLSETNIVGLNPNHSSIEWDDVSYWPS